MLKLLCDSEGPFASVKQAKADELAYKVGLAVYDMAGGVGDRPVAP